jgi:hypothetical protein
MIDKSVLIVEGNVVDNSHTYHVDNSVDNSKLAAIGGKIKNDPGKKQRVPLFDSPNRGSEDFAAGCSVPSTYAHHRVIEDFSNGLVSMGMILESPADRFKGLYIVIRIIFARALVLVLSVLSDACVRGGVFIALFLFSVFSMGTGTRSARKTPARGRVPFPGILVVRTYY